MNQERGYEPARDTAYGIKDDWLKWEEPRDVPEAGPKEPRNEMGMGVPEESKQAAKATVAFYGKAGNALKLATSLLPNRTVAEIETLAAALLNAPRELIEAADATFTSLSTPAVAPVVEAQKPVEAEPKEPVSAAAETSVVETQPEVVESEKVAPTTPVQASDGVEISFGPFVMESDEAAEPAASFSFEEEKGVEGSALNPEDDLLGILFAEGLQMPEQVIAKVAKKGIQKLAGGPRETGTYSVSNLQALWPSAPDVSQVFGKSGK
jgi:hypothetical protein